MNEAPKTTAGREAPRPVARRRGRGRQRGATIFLVTLVMTLLAALGVFAARATSLAGRASGYLRQGEQTHYLLQHGMALALNEVDRGKNVYGSKNTNSAVTNQTCSTTSTFPGVTIPCVKFTTDPTSGDGMGSFGQMVNRAQLQAGKSPVPPLSLPNVADLSVAPGSLGASRLLPSMYVEMTDFAEMDRTPPGYAVSGGGSQFHFRQATLVGWGQVGPYPANGPTASCSDATEKGSALVVSREAGRGQIIFGPID